MPSLNPLALVGDADGLWRDACMSAARDLADPLLASSPIGWGKGGLSWSAVERAMASCYAAAYADDPRIRDEYLSSISDWCRQRSIQGPLSTSLVRGLLAAAVQHGAVDHSRADIDLTADDFSRRAWEALDIGGALDEAWGSFRAPSHVARAASLAAVAHEGPADREEKVSHGIV